MIVVMIILKLYLIPHSGNHYFPSPILLIWKHMNHLDWQLCHLILLSICCWCVYIYNRVRIQLEGLNLFRPIFRNFSLNVGLLWIFLIEHPQYPGLGPSCPWVECMMWFIGCLQPGENRNCLLSVVPWFHVFSAISFLCLEIPIASVFTISLCETQ